MSLLKFEYCECGCHCFEASFLRKSYSIFICLNEDYSEKCSILRKDGDYSGKEYPSYVEAKEAAEQDVLLELKKHEKEIKVALRKNKSK